MENEYYAHKIQNSGMMIEIPKLFVERTSIIAGDWELYVRHIDRDMAIFLRDLLNR